MDTNQEKRKQKGLIAYNKWRTGPFRGHWDKRKEIIDEYDLTDEDINEYKKEQKRRYYYNNKKPKKKDKD